MENLKEKIFKINRICFILSIAFFICIFLPFGKVFDIICLILISINLGVGGYNMWVNKQLDKIK